MKKLVLVLAIALIAVPSFGAVTVTLNQVGTTAVYDVDYATSDANLPRAFALTVAVDGGAKISAVTPAMTGECTETVRGYGIFPGTIDLTDVNNPVWNTPVAPANDPGATGTGIGTGTVVLEMGSLYVDNNSPATSGTLCSLTIDCNGATGDVNLAGALESTYRGGVVMENGDQPSVTIDPKVYSCAPAECMKSTAAGYANWLAAGKPDCWCYEFQPLGDVDGKEQGVGIFAKRIASVDLSLFAPVYGKKRSQLVGSEICADIDHLDQGVGIFAKAVASVDLAILANNYGKKTSQLDSSPYAADYNFWIIAP